MENEYCGTCKYHRHDGNDYMCNCPVSDGYGEYTMFYDYCDEYKSVIGEKRV